MSKNSAAYAFDIKPPSACGGGTSTKKQERKVAECEAKVSALTAEQPARPSRFSAAESAANPTHPLNQPAVPRPQCKWTEKSKAAASGSSSSAAISGRLSQRDMPESPREKPKMPTLPRPGSARGKPTESPRGAPGTWAQEAPAAKARREAEAQAEAGYAALKAKQQEREAAEAAEAPRRRASMPNARPSSAGLGRERDASMVGGTAGAPGSSADPLSKEGMLASLGVGGTGASQAPARPTSAGGTRQQRPGSAGKSVAEGDQNNAVFLTPRRRSGAGLPGSAPLPGSDKSPRGTNSPRDDSLPAVKANASLTGSASLAQLPSLANSLSPRPDAVGMTRSGTQAECRRPGSAGKGESSRNDDAEQSRVPLVEGGCASLADMPSMPMSSRRQSSAMSAMADALEANEEGSCSMEDRVKAAAKSGGKKAKREEARRKVMEKMAQRAAGGGAAEAQDQAQAEGAADTSPPKVGKLSLTPPAFLDKDARQHTPEELLEVQKLSHDDGVSPPKSKASGSGWTPPSPRAQSAWEKAKAEAEAEVKALEPTQVERDLIKRLTDSGYPGVPVTEVRAALEAQNGHVGRTFNRLKFKLEKEKDAQLEREMEMRWKGTGASAVGGADTPRNEEERKREAAKAWAKQKAKEEKKAKEEEEALQREAEKAAAESKARKEAKEKAEKEKAKAAAKAKAEAEAKEKAEAAAKAKAEAEALAKAAAEAKAKVEAEAAAKAEKERKQAEEAQAKKEAAEAEAKKQAEEAEAKKHAEEAAAASKLKAAGNAALMVEKAKPPTPYLKDLGRAHTDEMNTEVATLDGVDGLNSSVESSPAAMRPEGEAAETDEFGAPVEAPPREAAPPRAADRMRNLGKMKAAAAPPPPPPPPVEEPGPSGAAEEDGGFRMYNDGELMMEEGGEGGEGGDEGEGEVDYDDDDPDAAMEAAAHLAHMEQAAALQAAADSAAAQAAALMEASEQAQQQALEVAGLASPRSGGGGSRPGSASTGLRHVPACTTDLRRLGSKLPNPDDLESGKMLLGEDGEASGVGGGAALDDVEDDDGGADGDAEAKKREKKKKKKKRKQAAAAKNGKKKGPGACATCCGLLLGNCWLIMFVMSILGTLAYDGFTTNEVDYWYPVRLCPRRANKVGVGTTFDQLSALPLPSSYTCRAATNALQCYGPACFGDCVGLTDPQQCTDCCGGTVGDALQPCRFPFYFQRTWHSTCLAGDGGSIHWCPTALGSDGRPLTTTRDDGTAVMLAGQCAAACRQADFVSAPATICGETTCSDAGTTPRAIPIEIRRDGFDGDAGFFLGAKYRLVLYAAADTLDASVTLRTSSGTQIYRGTFNRSACREAEDGARMRRLGGDGGPGDEDEEEDDEDDEDDVFGAAAAEMAGAAGRLLAEVVGEERASGAAESLGRGMRRGAQGMRRGVREARRRLAIVRRETWWVDMINRNTTHLRRREGEAARWNGRDWVRPKQGVRCAADVVPRNTIVALQGGCDSPSGEHRLERSMLRAEIGPWFTVDGADFPLYLTVLGVNSSDRGPQDDSSGDVHGAEPLPQLYFSFYTEELNMSQRLGMWVGVPLGFILFSCCCFCMCCFCCSPPKKKSDDDLIKEGRELLAADARAQAALDGDEPLQRFQRAGLRAAAARNASPFGGSPLGNVAYRINSQGLAVPDDGQDSPPMSPDRRGSRPRCQPSPLGLRMTPSAAVLNRQNTSDSEIELST